MLKFPVKTEKTAKSVDEAIALGLEELKIDDISEVNVEVLEEGSKGFLGLGSKEAHVKLSVKDANAAIAKRFLKDVFEAMKLEVNIDAKSGEGNTLNIDLSGEYMGIIIGKRGDTLDSLQYLTSLIVNHESDEYIKVTLDTENYREKRVEALLKLAERLGNKVARTGRKYTLEPMNPYERRIIHASLQDNEDITTFSVGEDPYRKVVIAPKNPAPRRSRSYSAASSERFSIDYAASYSDYKKTAPRHDVVKKAENFEAYRSAHENNSGSEVEE